MDATELHKTQKRTESPSVRNTHNVGKGFPRPCMGFRCSALLIALILINIKSAPRLITSEIWISIESNTTNPNSTINFVYRTDQFVSKTSPYTHLVMNFTEEVNLNLPKPPLKFNGGLANFGLNSSVNANTRNDMGINTTKMTIDSSSSTGAIYLRSSGRLGNTLYQCAMLISLKHLTGRAVYLISNISITSVFPNLSVPSIKPSPELLSRVHRLPRLDESKSGTFSPNFTSHLPPGDILICCYFQSVKYFHDIRTRVRNEMSINSNTSATADRILRAAIQQHFGKTEAQGIKLVGIHVRRSDYGWKINYNNGYRLPEPSYFHKAKSYFRRVFPGRILFVVTTDDRRWSKRHLAAPDTFISPIQRPDLDLALTDMALLTACNGTILSIGSFGWWAGFMARGPKVYFRDYKVSGSRVDNRIRSEDMFATPDWIPMGNWNITSSHNMWPLLLYSIQ